MTSGSGKLPKRIVMSRRKMLGPRQSVRERMHNRSSHKIARWPEDALTAASIPLLICVVGGQADLCMGEYVLHCDKGSFIIIPPGVPYPDDSQPHLDKARRKEGWCDLLWVSGMGREGGLQCWICHSRGAAHPRKEVGEGGFVPDPRTGQYFHAFLEEALHAEESGQAAQLSQSLLVATLCAMQREIAANRCFYPGMRVEDASQNADKQTAIGYAQAYMASHVFKVLTIDEVAHAVYMSRAQFTRRFRSETGKTFVQYLTELRLAEATRLLRDTQWSVQAICRMVGLSSSSHLRKLLRDRAGILPSEVRRGGQSSNCKKMS